MCPLGHLDPQTLWSSDCLQLARAVSVRISSATPLAFFPKGQFGSIEVKQELRSTLTFEPHLCLPLNSFGTLNEYETSPLSPFPPL